MEGKRGGGWRGRERDWEMYEGCRENTGDLCSSHNQLPNLLVEN